jgi:hypothetical protein
MPDGRFGLAINSPQEWAFCSDNRRSSASSCCCADSSPQGVTHVFGIPGAKIDAVSTRSLMNSSRPCPKCGFAFEPMKHSWTDAKISVAC